MHALVLIFFLLISPSHLPPLSPSLVFSASFHLLCLSLPAFHAKPIQPIFVKRTVGTFWAGTGAVNTTDAADKGTYGETDESSRETDDNDGQVLHSLQMINCRTQLFFPGPTRDSVKVNTETWWNSKQSDPQQVKMWKLSSIWSMLTRAFCHLVQNKTAARRYERVKEHFLACLGFKTKNVLKGTLKAAVHNISPWGKKQRPAPLPFSW